MRLTDLYHLITTPLQPSNVRRSDDSMVEHRTSVPLAPRQTRAVTLPVEPLVTGAVTVTLYTEHRGVKHILRDTVHVRVRSRRVCYVGKVECRGA